MLVMMPSAFLNGLHLSVRLQGCSGNCQRKARPDERRGKMPPEGMTPHSDSCKCVGMVHCARIARRPQLQQTVCMSPSIKRPHMKAKKEHHNLWNWPAFIPSLQAPLVHITCTLPNRSHEMIVHHCSSGWELYPIGVALKFHQEARGKAHGPRLGKAQGASHQERQGASLLHREAEPLVRKGPGNPRCTKSLHKTGLRQTGSRQSA